VPRTSPAAEATRYDFDRLHGFVQTALVAAGATPSDARTAGEVLVSTDARGVTSHGVRTLPHHLETLRRGGTRSPAQLTVVRESAVTAVIDGGGGLGLVVADHAMRLAISKARAHGVGIVLVRGSNHFGAAGHYALMAAQARLIGLASSNASPIMTIAGARTKSISNAPFAYAVPSPSGPIHLDIAMSASAGMKVRRAAAAGEPIPAGWILDHTGAATTDPAEYARGGSLLPMSGHKGSGLAVLTELLAGALSGAGMLSDIVPWLIHTDTQTNAGHVLVALDPACFLDPDVFAARVQHLIDELHAQEPAAGVERILLPGELENHAEAEARTRGIPLDGDVVALLRDLAATEGLADELDAARIPHHS